MNSLLHRIALGALVTATAAVPAAQAADFKVKPRPGLWKTETKVLINGVDMMAQIEATRKQMMANMPPEARARMEAAMPPTPQSEELECLTQAQIDKITDPVSWFKEQEGLSNCAFEVTHQSAHKIQFKGTCKATGKGAESFSGTLSGEFSASSDTAWRMEMKGKGMVPGPNGQPQSVTQNVTSKGTWQKSDCGNVKPEPTGKP